MIKIKTPFMIKATSRDDISAYSVFLDDIAQLDTPVTILNLGKDGIWFRALIGEDEDTERMKQLDDNENDPGWNTIVRVCVV